MSVTTTQGNAMLAAFFGADPGYPTVSSPLYIGLSTTTPTASGGNITEPAAADYARIEFDNTSVGAYWTTPTAGSCNNAKTLTFAESVAEWASTVAPVTHIFFSDHPDSVQAANILYYSELQTARAIPANTTVYFTVGSIIISIA